MDIKIEISEKGKPVQALSFVDVDDVDHVILMLQGFQYEYDAQRDAKTHDNDNN